LGDALRPRRQQPAKFISTTQARKAEHHYGEIGGRGPKPASQLERGRPKELVQLPLYRQFQDGYRQQLERMAAEISSQRMGAAGPVNEHSRAWQICAAWTSQVPTWFGGGVAGPQAHRLSERNGRGEMAAAVDARHREELSGGAPTASKCANWGIDDFRIVRGLNEPPRFIAALTGLVRRRL
jgi:hypothetical protein